MTADEIAAMQADALAGTPGDWLSAKGLVYALMHYDWHKGVERFQNVFSAQIQHHHSVALSQVAADLARIARVPCLEAAVTALTAQAEADQIKIEAQAAQIVRLREALVHADEVARDLGWHRIYDVTSDALWVQP